jgi:hypothetical protein
LRKRNNELLLLHQYITKPFIINPSSQKDNMLDVKTTLSEAEEKMEMAVMYLEDALAHIRAGKANVRILDGIRVELLRQQGAFQQRRLRLHARCAHHRHQAVGQEHV